MKIELADESKKRAIASLRRYFAAELDQEIGDLKAAHAGLHAAGDRSVDL